MLLETYLSFFGVAVLLALTPGPDNAFLLALSASQGARHGLQLILGLCSGLLLHTLLAVTGLSAVLVASPTAFTLLGGAGALYLIWLALNMWNSTPVEKFSYASPQPGTLFRRGLLMNLSNPKVMIFFIALLPQFTGSHPSPQVLITLGLLMTLATFMVFGSLALLGGTLLHWPRWQRFQLWLNRLTAIVMVLAAGKLLWHYLVTA